MTLWKIKEDRGFAYLLGIIKVQEKIIDVLHGGENSQYDISYIKRK